MRLIINCIKYNRVMELEENSMNFEITKMPYYFQLAAELGKVEIFKCLLNHFPNDLLDYEDLMNCALIGGHLSMIQFIFQKYPKFFSRLDGHLRVFNYVPHTTELHLAKFLLTHYAFEESLVVWCFEYCLENGKRQSHELVQLYLALFYTSFLHKYIAGSRFDWRLLSQRMESFESIYKVYQFHPEILPQVSDDCLAFINICENTQNKAATCIQRNLRRNVLYKPHSKSAQRLAKSDWLKLSLN